MKRANKPSVEKTSKIERAEEFKEEMERKKRQRKNMYRRKVRKNKKKKREWMNAAVNRFIDNDDLDMI